MLIILKWHTLKGLKWGLLENKFLTKSYSNDYQKAEFIV